MKEKKLKLGYVGHWDSAGSTVNYVRNILKVLEEKNLSLDYHNTACSSMSDPQKVQNFLNEVTPKLGGRTISIQGNQAISTGMWDPLLPGKHNFTAKATSGTDQEEVGLPKCKSMVNKGCWAYFQEGETGLCEEKNGSKSILECTKDVDVEYTKRVRIAGGKRIKRVKKTKKKNVWKRVEVKASEFISYNHDRNHWRYKMSFSGEASKFNKNFGSEENRAIYLAGLRDRVNNIDENTYKNMKFKFLKKESEIYKDHWLPWKKGKWVPTGRFTTYVSYYDPIDGKTIERRYDDETELEDLKKHARDKGKEVSDLKEHLKKPIFESTPSNRKYYVSNGSIGYKKTFSSEEEAQNFLEKIKKAKQKELEI